MALDQKIKDRPAEAPPKKDAESSGMMELLKIVAMPLVTLIVGFLINASLSERQEKENNSRMYAEVMGKREEADSNLRKDMFQSILATFLSKDPKLSRDQRLEQELVNLELLAYNFHESLDLAPLFKHVRRDISEGNGGPDAERAARLEKAAVEVNERQLAVLSGVGAVIREGVDNLPNLNQMAVDLSNSDLYTPTKLSSTDPAKAASQISRLCLQMGKNTREADARQFRLEATDYDKRTREVQVRLYVSRPLSVSECERADLDLIANKEIDIKFWVGLFDFPMIDNTRLTLNERCAVVMTVLTPYNVAELVLTYFPGSRASLKDKPYYDELMHEVLKPPASTNPRYP